ncbi:MAG: hypothetical protein K2Q12_04135, partial [Rickettsiales bacterium]|nr:hypothetical protein [Rickettsiales bacterium]
MKTSSINASAANRSQLYSELLIPLNQGFPKKTLEQVLPYLEQDASDSELWFIHGVALKRLGD